MRKGSNLLPLSHIVLITCFVLFQEKFLAFDRKKDLKSDFKKGKRFEESTGRQEVKDLEPKGYARIGGHNY